MTSVMRLLNLSANREARISLFSGRHPARTNHIEMITLHAPLSSTTNQTCTFLLSKYNSSNNLGQAMTRNRCVLSRVRRFHSSIADIRSPRSSSNKARHFISGAALQSTPDPRTPGQGRTIEDEYAVIKESYSTHCDSLLRTIYVLNLHRNSQEPSRPSPWPIGFRRAPRSRQLWTRHPVLERYKGGSECEWHRSHHDVCASFGLHREQGEDAGQEHWRSSSRKERECYRVGVSLGYRSLELT